MAAGLGDLLGVWAHPDDEMWLSAGLMADAVRDGRRVVCVTATRGEAGSQDPERWPNETMGEVRAGELVRSLEALGVREHHWLGYPDGGCEGIPDDEGIARVEALLRAAEPDTVLTFGPEGMTGHPDHIAVSRWTSAAFARAAKPGARLCHAIQTEDWVRRWAPRLEAFNVFMVPGTPPVAPREDLEIRFALPPDLVALKDRAMRAHESQVAGMLAVFGEDMISAADEEKFVLGARR